LHHTGAGLIGDEHPTVLAGPEVAQGGGVEGEVSGVVVDVELRSAHLCLGLDLDEDRNGDVPARRGRDVFGDAEGGVDPRGGGYHHDAGQVGNFRTCDANRLLGDVGGIQPGEGAIAGGVTDDA